MCVPTVIKLSCSGNFYLAPFLMWISYTGTAKPDICFVTVLYHCNVMYNYCNITTVLYALYCTNVLQYKVIVQYNITVIH